MIVNTVASAPMWMGTAKISAGMTTAPVSVTVTVQLGTPVRVRKADIGIDGDGSDDRYLERTEASRVEADGP